MPPLDAHSTALILIDLQKGILAQSVAPRPSAQVLATGRMLADRFRAAGAPVVLVNVGWASDYADVAPGQTDIQPTRPVGGPPAGWMDLADGLATPADIRITKRHWGAFHGTELDLQLRRRGVRTVVIGGIATNFGVESTVRSAWEHGYDVVVVEDACAGVSPELHAVAFEHIFPRISRVVTADHLELT